MSKTRYMSSLGMVQHLLKTADSQSKSIIQEESSLYRRNQPKIDIQSSVSGLSKEEDGPH